MPSHTQWSGKVECVWQAERLEESGNKKQSAHPYILFSNLHRCNRIIVDLMSLELRCLVPADECVEAPFAIDLAHNSTEVEFNPCSVVHGYRRGQVAKQYRPLPTYSM